MYSDIAITLEHLAKTYLLYNTPKDRLKQMLWRGRRQYFRTLEALKPVNLTIRKGETVGIVGQNGSGKSTLLQMVCGTLTPTSGVCSVKGRISALLELGAGFNPEFTGRENVYLNSAILGLTKQETDEKFDNIAEFAGIGEMMEQPVKTYSSGMYVRLAFAVAVASDPDILIVDEALAVGDEVFQRKCFGRIRQIQEQGGTILFVSHSAHTVIDLCNRAILLDRGELLYQGSPREVIANYHKLIYAPKEKLDSFRERLKSGHALEGDEDAPAPPTLKEGLESQVVYESHGAFILNPQVTTLTGEPVTLLSARQRYVYSYDVRFDCDAYQVRFGMMINTGSGLPLGGATSHPYERTIPHIQEGVTMKVRFSFECLLLPGTYFLNAGCSGVVNGERITLHRIVDAALFRVLPDQDTFATGMVDFRVEVG